MSRGGRGGGRGGKKGPDMSWDDEESVDVLPNTRKPGPLFPDRYFPVPKPLTPAEKSSISSQIHIRDRIRRGPLYAILDPTITHSHPPNQVTLKSAPPRPSKPNPRAGFDPFTDQEKYTMKYHRKRRTYPDLTTRAGYSLRFFPLELWPILDPTHKSPDWSTLTDDQKSRITNTATTRSQKRKRANDLLKFDDNNDDDAPRPRNSGSEASDNDNSNTDNEDEDEDGDVLSSRRRRRKNKSTSNNKTNTAGKQKKGLDAEDEYPDVEQDEDGDGNPDDGEPGDSEFGTDDDDDSDNDYNGESYFDGGEDDGDGGGGGDDGGEDAYQ